MAYVRKDVGRLTAGERKLDEEEFLDVFHASIDDLLAWLKEGKVTDVKTVIGAFWLDKIRSGAWNIGAIEDTK